MCAHAAMEPATPSYSRESFSQLGRQHFVFYQCPDCATITPTTSSKSEKPRIETSRALENFMYVSAFISPSIYGIAYKSDSNAAP
jgi:hypothetical protein